jgi:hypothetical protein
VRISPQLAFGIDVATLGALTLVRPPRYRADLIPRAPLHWVAKTALGAAALFFVIAGVFLLAFDNPAQALARLRGEAITVEPEVRQVGDGIAGQGRAISLEVINHTDTPICVIGGSTSCSCMTAEDLPLTVPAREQRSLAIRVTFKGKPGRFLHRFVFYTDSKKQPVVVVRLAGRVIDPSP